MISMIETCAPEIFTWIAKNDSCFHCSKSFVQSYLRRHHWSMHHSTRAAQKVPDNAEIQCKQSFLCQAKAIHDDRIPAALQVNSDQTNVQIVPEANETWNKPGQQQVAVNGKDDKCAFTVMNGISALGVVLLMQAIYVGKIATVLSKCTSRNAKAWDEIEKTNSVHFNWSGKDSYWLTMRTIKTYVNDILVPYFTATKKELGLSEIQLCIWQIDC